MAKGDTRNDNGLNHLLDTRLRRPRDEIADELKSLIVEGTHLRLRGSELPDEYEWVEPWKFTSWRQDLDRWNERVTHALGNAFTTSAVARDFLGLAGLEERPFPTPFDALVSFGNSLSGGLSKLTSIYQRLDLFGEDPPTQVPSSPTAKTGRPKSRWSRWSVLKRAVVVALTLLGAAASAVTVAEFYFDEPWRDHGSSQGATGADQRREAVRPGAVVTVATMRGNGTWQASADQRGSEVKLAPLATKGRLDVLFSLRRRGWVYVTKPLASGQLNGTRSIRFRYKGTGAANTIEPELLYPRDAGRQPVVFGAAAHRATNTNGKWRTLQVAYSRFSCWAYTGCKTGELVDPKRVRGIAFAISNKPASGDIAGRGSFSFGEIVAVRARRSPPERVTVECDAPSRLRPGKVVTLAYDIKSDAAVDVGLGAALYDENEVDHARGTGDRDSVHLQRGHNRVTRPFMIPVGLPVGTYELDAEIWPANKIGDNGVETFADSPCGFVTIP
jgi:hypothetical protein